MTQISIYEEYAYTSIWREHHNHQHRPHSDQIQQGEYKIWAPYIHVCIICTHVMCSVCAHQCQFSHTQLYVVILIHRNPKVTFTQNEHYTHDIIHIHRSTVDRKRIFPVLHICQPCDCHMIPSTYGHVIVWQHVLYNIILVM